jgi:hypothetical protein
MFLDGGKNVFFAEKGQEVIAQGTRAVRYKNKTMKTHTSGDSQ